MNFTKEELRDLAITATGLSLLSGLFNFNLMIAYFIIYTFSTAFKVFCQKLTADKFDLEAKYSFDYNLFIVSLVVSLMSFGSLIFPILGSVKTSQKSIKRIGKYYSNITFNEKGWVSLIGILSSIALIIVSLLLLNLSPGFFQKMVDINTLILLFSIIPLAKFDGSNILWWNRFLWIALFVCSMLFSFMTVFKINIILSLLLAAVVFVLIFLMWENVLG